MIGFPFGIINVVTYVYIFFATGLYANAMINGYFFIMTVYGWYNWSRKSGGDSVVKIRKTTIKEWPVILVSLFLAVGGIYLLLSRLTESQVPVWDSLTTAAYMIAQWMISRKMLENWLLWLFADIIMTALCLYQGLWFTALQYAVFTGIATDGYFEWRRKVRV
jgi:nicotinamide mononucleotide transporter